MVESLAETGGQFKSTSIADQLHHVARAVQDSAAVLAILEVFPHAGAQFGSKLVVDVIRQLAPYFKATYFNGPIKLHCPVLN